jgi:hypothetical protein
MLRATQMLEIRNLEKLFGVFLETFGECHAKVSGRKPAARGVSLA